MVSPQLVLQLFSPYFDVLRGLTLVWSIDIGVTGSNFMMVLVRRLWELVVVVVRHRSQAVRAMN